MSAAGVEDVEVGAEALQDWQVGSRGSRRRRQERRKVRENMGSGGILVIFTFFSMSQFFTS